MLLRGSGCHTLVRRSSEAHPEQLKASLASKTVYCVSLYAGDPQLARLLKPRAAQKLPHLSLRCCTPSQQQPRLHIARVVCFTALCLMQHMHRDL